VVGHLYRVPSLGGESRKVLDDVAGRVSFAPDGERFVFLRQDRKAGDTHLVVAGIDSSEQTVLSTMKAPDSYNDPVWSPDGETIAASLFSFSEGIKAKVVAIPAAGGEVEPISDTTWGGMDEISWLPDGSGLVLTAAPDPISNSQLWEVSYPQGVARRVTNDLNGYHGTGITADGKTLVTQVMETSQNLWVTEAGQRSGATRITSGMRTLNGIGVDWSADGTIYYGSNSSGDYDLWAIRPDGNESRQLTTSEGIDVNPDLSPDGEQITFISTRAGKPNIWRIDRDGTNAVQITKGNLEFGQLVSADGKWLYYSTAGPNLFRIPVDGGEAEVVLEGRVASYDLSPDGSRLLAQVLNTDLQAWEVGIYPIEGGEPEQKLDLQRAFQLTWSPDGKAITYVLVEEGIPNVWNQPLDGGDPTQLTYFDDDELNNLNDYAWSPDGRQLVISRGSQVADIVLLKNFR
jgi:TolB protein